MKSPKQHRLLTGQQFRAVYNQGQKLNHPFFTAFILGTSGNSQRLGITVTRKIGGAVIRNRCKRRMREVFRLRDTSACAEFGFDLVLNVRLGVVSARFEELVLALQQTLSRFSNQPKRGQSKL